MSFRQQENCALFVRKCSYWGAIGKAEQHRFLQFLYFIMRKNRGHKNWNNRPILRDCKKKEDERHCGFAKKK